MGKFGGNNGNNRRVQRGGPARGPRPQGGFKNGGGDRPRQGGNRAGGFRRGGREEPRKGGFRRGGAGAEGGNRRGGRRGGRGGKPRDHSALDEDMLQYWDKAGVKDKRDEEKALQKAKLDKELEEYNKQAQDESAGAAAAPAK